MTCSGGYISRLAGIFKKTQFNILFEMMRNSQGHKILNSDTNTKQENMRSKQLLNQKNALEKCIGHL